MIKYIFLSFMVSTCLSTLQAFPGDDDDQSYRVQAKKYKQEIEFDIHETEQRITEFATTCLLKKGTVVTLSDQIKKDITELAKQGNHAGLVWKALISDPHSKDYNDLLNIAQPQMNEIFQGGPVFIGFTPDEQGSHSVNVFNFPPQTTLKVVFDTISDDKSDDHDIDTMSRQDRLHEKAVADFSEMDMLHETNTKILDNDMLNRAPVTPNWETFGFSPGNFLNE